MRRRRTLIDDYLRQHNPVERPEASRPRASATADRRRRSSGLRRTSLPALAAITTVVVIAAVALMPGRATRGGSPFLTAEAAVATASSDLEHRGILHWTFTDGSVPQNRGGGAVEQWLDLRTRATFTIYPGIDPKLRGGKSRATYPKRAWYNGQRTYRVDWNRAFKRSDPRRLIVRTVRRRGEPIPEILKTTPIDKLRELLAAAARGEATLTAAPDEQGVPVVKVTTQTRNEAGAQTVTTWMTREQTPRQLRTFTTFKPSAKQLRDATPKVRRQMLAFKGATMRFDTWELLPRTPENLAKVQPPVFDPKEYKVVTQFLGPPKR